MKKNFLVFILSILLAIPGTLLFTACDEPIELINLEDHMITVGYENHSRTYDGTAKEPEITVSTIDEIIIPTTAYTVNYQNNINAGTATVLVTAVENNGIIKGSASTTFEIIKTHKLVNSFEQLKAATTNINYTHVQLIQDIEIPVGETLTIANDCELRLGDFTLTNNGAIENNGKLTCKNPTLVNNGTISNSNIVTVEVDSKEELEKALTFASNIKLTGNITLASNEKINIDADVAGKDINVTIDLNGYSISNFVRVCGKTHTANVTINNFASTSATIGTETSSYGLVSIGEKAIITLNDVDFKAYYAALSTNGNYAGGTITATNCTFTAYSKELGNNSGLGAYLPAKNTYDFTLCDFIGGTGYYAKSGTHSLLNCTFTGNQETYTNPRYYGNGGCATGSALVVDSSANYQSPLLITISGGECNSTAGNGIEIYTTGNTNPYSTVNILNNPTYTTVLENVRSWYSTWNGTDVTPISTTNAVENVITIKTAAELAGLAAAVNAGETFEGYTIRLDSDIDLANYEFTPIGYGNTNYVGKVLSGNHFSGIFDGQDHTIHNLKITAFNKGGITDETKSTGIALFGSTFNAEIKNVKVNTANIISNHYVGVIAGHALNTDITNCHVLNAVVDCQFANTGEEAGDKAGAIVGHFAKGTKAGSAAALTNCSATNSTVKADRDAGQLIGCLSNKATQENNTATNVTVEWNESSTGKVDDSYTKENTNIKEDLVGRVA